MDLRRFDHSAIYLLIAGTYTPFIAQLKNSFAASGLLTGVWLTAGIGVVLKLMLPGRFDGVAVVLYLLLGWSGVMAYESMIATLPTFTFWLLATGGVLYSMGVIAGGQSARRAVRPRPHAMRSYATPASAG